MKKILISLILITLLGNCFGQQSPDSFSYFLSKFKHLDFPIEPDKFLDIGENIQLTHIPKNMFDKFLRTGKDGFWKFTKDFDYTYNGKFSVSGQFIVLFYTRNYMPDDPRKQIGEIVLLIFTKDGKKLSNLVIGGSYNDNLTFSSIIHSPENIEVNYIEYQKSKEKKYTKHYSITKDGLIIGEK